MENMVAGKTPIQPIFHETRSQAEKRYKSEYDAAFAQSTVCIQTQKCENDSCL